MLAFFNSCIMNITDKKQERGKQLAKKYYDKLFKEYCLADLSFYQENKIAMRWRTESEVIKGKGQFSCGSVKCDTTDALTSWEVNFGYLEHGEKKKALVKLRLCTNCSYKLNYHQKKRKATKTISSYKEQLESMYEKDLQGETSVTSSSTPPIIDHDVATISEAGKSVEMSEIWKKTFEKDVKKTRDYEFELYLSEMLI